MKRGHRAEGSQVKLTLLPTGRRASERRSNAGSSPGEHVSMFANGCFSAAAPKIGQGPFTEGQPASETLASPAAAKQPG